MIPPALAAALAPGTVINGKYRVEHPLGAGGMGVVVAARHLELNQNLAIKVLLPNAASSNEAITRFLREGRAAAQVTSPHVAKVHDSGRLPSGAPYLVMELLRGRDLRAHLLEIGRVPLAQAIDWILQAAHALAEAHRRHIIHRDVKPANLFLAETSTGPQIKVLDFGISKQLDSTDAALTNTASAIGTPRYMAPEQMRSARFADARGDVWSLGIVLYELTTGQYPFRGDTITALCFDIMERTPTPPSELNRELPPSFDEIVARCLEKDPSERFQSMEAFANALCSVAPASRSSGLFDAAALSASVVTGTTPGGAIATPEPGSATRHDPQTPLLSPLAQDLPPHETMRAWDTTAMSRPTARKAARMPLIALGVGIGVASATLVGMVFNRQPSTSAAHLERGVIAAAHLTAPVTPEAAVEAPVEPAIVADAPEPTAPAISASAAPAKPPPPACRPPYYTDKKGYRRAKPWCQ